MGGAAERQDGSVRVGILGFGYAAATFHAPLVAEVPGLRLAAIASSRPAHVHAAWPEVEVHGTPEALIAAVDLVVIPTPNETHFPLALQALEAGRHVVVDKPFTLTLAQAQELERRAAQVGRLLSVFHNRRWDSDFLTLRQVLREGHLGRIVQFESHFDRYRPEVRDRWRERPGPGAGLWYDLGPHLLDQALRLFGQPEGIVLDLARQREGAQVDDWFHAVLRYGEMRAVLHAGALVPVPAPRFVVHGELGTFQSLGLDPQEDALKAGQDRRDLDFGCAELTTWAAGRSVGRLVPRALGDYRAYYAALRDALLGRGPNPVPPAEAVAVMQLLELGLQSAGERRELPTRAPGCS